MWSLSWAVCQEPAQRRQPLPPGLDQFPKLRLLDLEIAISDARIQGLDDDQVRQSYREHRDGLHKTLTPDAAGFIRRFLLHVLPKGLMRVGDA